MKKISTMVDDAPLTPELNEVFDKIRKALNAPFTPNFFKVWAVSPASLEGIWPVMRNILTGGKVERKLKEMIFVAISSLKECHYCEAAHHAFCLSIGVTPEQIKSLIKYHTCETTDTKEKIAIDYAVKLAKDANSSSEAAFNSVKKAGYSDEEVMEIIAMSGMAVFYNHLANATKINIDKGFLEKLASKEAMA
ncbi:peroxidase-related enzyme [Fulvivirgaceae bacterium BMA12]|uniref:Peroxidase-related enzyme n=1 Tax=Agaribacillus aureus TaxID=3051825 RepID=A0ABT8L0K5_9BACT|nr:peroxidase-related enzyme [Fulvivirgaceae bacterium BMA12]